MTKSFQSIRDLVNKVGSMLGGSEPKQEAAEPDVREAPRHPENRPAEASGPGRIKTLESQFAVHSAAARDEFMPDQAVAFTPDSAPFTPDSTSSFADLIMDDQMIEAKPADEYGDTLVSSRRTETPSPTASHADFDKTSAGLASDTGAPWADDENLGFVPARKTGEEALAAHSAFATHLASAAQADDALLDLGGVNSQPGTASAEADEFILDLEDDVSSPPPRSTVHDDDVFDLDAPAYEWPEGAFAPAHAERERAVPVAPQVLEQVAAPPSLVSSTEPQEAPALRDFIEPTVVPAKEPADARAMMGYEDGSVEGDVARPPVAAAAHVETTLAPSVGHARVGVEELIGLEQLSPEAIDAIARRAVEMLSEKVVREIAWEVVPQLAELLIRRRLDEEAGAKQ